MTDIRYRAGGWLDPDVPISWQRNDHGKDLVMPWNTIIKAPGDFVCLGNGNDVGFPNGFGPRFALIHIEDRSSKWNGFNAYLGHCTSLVAPGQRGPARTPLARANQGHPNSIGVFPPNPPGNGGWLEFGEFFPATGRCGIDSPTGHWYNPRLMNDLVVHVPDHHRTLKLHMQGPDVLRATSWLHDCGYLQRRWWHYTPLVHDAVVAFQRRHRITGGNGEIGPRTRPLLQRNAHWCRVHKHPEVNGPLLTRVEPLLLAPVRGSRRPEGVLIPPVTPPEAP